jgi:hypothetical protein
MKPSVFLFALLFTVWLSACKKDSAPSSPSPTSLTSNPATISVAVGDQARADISGGTSPLQIKEPPSSSLAAAYIFYNSALIVTGLAVGQTSATVHDPSAPSRTITVPITVTAGGGPKNGSGTISFSSPDRGTFFANGVYYDYQHLGSGAGGWVGSEPYGPLGIVHLNAFRVNFSPHDISQVSISISDTIPQSYSIGGYRRLPGYAWLGYTPHYIDTLPGDQIKSYAPDDGVLVISSFTRTNVKGSFSGSAFFSGGMTVTAGTFDINYVRR